MTLFDHPIGDANEMANGKFAARQGQLLGMVVDGSVTNGVEVLSLIHI